MGHPEPVWITGEGNLRGVGSAPRPITGVAGDAARSMPTSLSMLRLKTPVGQRILP